MAETRNEQLRRLTRERDQARAELERMSGVSHDEFFSFTQARDNARELAQARRRAEEEYKKQVEKAADAEVTFRKKYAAALLNAEGTVPEKEAIAKSATTDAYWDKEVQAGLVKACLERLKGLEGERAMLRLLSDWSQRHDGPQPVWSREAA